MTTSFTCMRTSRSTSYEFTPVTPTTNTAIPKCAMFCPQNDKPMRPGLRKRVTTCCKVPRPTQAPKKIPSMAPKDQPPNTNGSPTANTTAARPEKRKVCAISDTLASRQRAIVPGTIKNTVGTNSGANTALKYGGPTDSLPIFNASMIKG